MIYNEKNEYKNHHDHEHSHDNEEHSHEHVHGGHNHVNEISADCECKSNLNKEEETLKVLLVHWVEHNESHEEGFKEWVEKSKSMGKLETSESIQRAIEFMQKADDMLREARKSMVVSSEEKDTEHEHEHSHTHDHEHTHLHTHEHTKEQLQQM
ncbi:hypothetical protein [Clostridium thailandense]|uniref:hypothetical protein n=1 Tax=Clostridium thailandense TaxID=2794346 RepID=UPI0028AAD2F6|nr:hypothetical protein [Clostridium thailandense]